MEKRVIALLCLIALLGACAPGNKILIKNEAPWYFPSVLQVEPGDTVVWENMDVVVHPVNTLSGPEKFSSGHFTKNFEHTFNEPGVYHYFCPVHPYMQGFVGVGEEVPEDLVPYWAKQYPPETALEPVPGPLPAEPGVGEIWLDAQFEKVPGKEYAGTVVIIDAETWQVKDKIDDKRLNNPHNLWLSDDGNSIIQTNWFDRYVSIIDRYSGLLIKHIYVGESPAHVITANGKAYVTLQGADGIAVLDQTTWNVDETFRTVPGEHAHATGEAHAEPGTGPHGHWATADGKFFSVGNTEGGSMAVWSTETHEKVFEHETDPLPLMSGISADGKYAWAASLATGRFQVFDLESKSQMKEFNVGKAPIQQIPSPDGKYILVALTGDRAVAIVDAQTFDLVKTLPSGAGAHGVYYGPKQSGGWYAYVSNKFVPWVTVIDMDALEVAGYIPLPKDSLGGQGILAIYE